MPAVKTHVTKKTAKKSAENNVETAPRQVVKIDQPIAQALAPLRAATASFC